MKGTHLGHRVDLGVSWRLPIDPGSLSGSVDRGDTRDQIWCETHAVMEQSMYTS